MYCPSCHTRRVVRIGVTLKGSSVTLSSCSACDLRWWEQDGSPVGLQQVFAMAGPERS
jgi:hypothetical protein